MSPAPRPYEYVCSAVWGRERDGALFLDVPIKMAELGEDGHCPTARRVFGRAAIRELRNAGVGGLIVAWVNGRGLPQ